MTGWNTFTRVDCRRGRRSQALHVDPKRSFDTKILSKQYTQVYGYILWVSKEVVGDAFCSELIRFLEAEGPLYIASYGIGSLFESAVSLYQYVMLLEMTRRLPGASAGLYDPVLTAAEYERAALDSIDRLAFPYRLNARSEGRTLLLYMPHCEAQTYAELLEDIHANTSLDRVLLYGSDLLGYAGLSPAEPHFHVQRQALLHDFSLRPDVFNDCHLQVLLRK